MPQDANPALVAIREKLDAATYCQLEIAFMQHAHAAEQAGYLLRLHPTASLADKGDANPRAA